MDWTEIKVVWFQEPQQYFFRNWAQRAWTISLLSLGSINRLSEGTRETKRREGVGTAQRSLQFSVQVMGPPVPTDMICQSYSIQCKKHRLCQRVDLKTKWNRWGQDEINCTRSSSIQCQFVFSKGAVRGKISNSKNWLEDKMGQDEINCTGSHFSYSQTLYCHDFSSCQRGFLQFKLSQSTGQSRGLLFTSAISWKPYQRILPCFSSCPCFQFSL